MRGHRILEHAGIALVALAGAGLGLEILDAAEGPVSWGLVALAASLGYASADLVSGLAHFVADRCGNPDTPVVGPTFIAPFREHHGDPLAISRHGFVTIAGNTCILSAPALLAAWTWLPLRPDAPAALGFAAWLLALTLALCATNHIHKWAHQVDPPAFARWLQRKGVVLSPAHHRRHHTPPFDRHYCITTGWSDRWLDRLLSARPRESPRGWFAGAAVRHRRRASRRHDPAPAAPRPPGRRRRPRRGW